MNCAECRELLVGYIEKLLDVQQGEMVRGHLKNCPDCQKELKQIMALQNRLVANGEVHGQNDLENTVMDRIIREDLSARRIEQIIVDLKKNRADAKMSPERQIKEQPYKVQLKRIQKNLKTEVSIQTNAKGSGRITIKFKDQSEFERLQNLLG